MKQTYITCLLFLWWGTLSAQIDFRNTMATGGGEYQSSFEIIQFTVGEAVIDFYTDTIVNTQATQGFQQPYFLLKALKSKSLCEIELGIWPNPTERFLHIEVGLDIKLEDVSCYLYNTSGAIVKKFTIDETEEIDLLRYQLNTFIMHFIDHKSNCHKVFKVIKSN